ncbi:MAG: hypothetical protein WCO55_05125 [Candidatus Falkowbacteria bacterium]
MKNGNAGMSGGFYGLAMIGAAVYFVQQASGTTAIILAILKAFVWPAFLIYQLFGFLHM